MLFPPKLLQLFLLFFKVFFLFFKYLIRFLGYFVIFLGMCCQSNLLTQNCNFDVVTVVDSVYIWMFSLDPDHVFMEGYTMRNIGFVGIVDCSVFIWISESCWKFLWLVDNWLVKIFLHWVKVFHWWYFILSDRISNVSRHLAMILL